MWLSPVERRHVEDRHVDGTRGAPTTRVRRARAVRGTPPCVWTARPLDGGGVGEGCDCATWVHGEIQPRTGAASRERRQRTMRSAGMHTHRERESTDYHAIRAHAGGPPRLRSRRCGLRLDRAVGLDLLRFFVFPPFS